MSRLYFKVLAWLLVTALVTGAGLLWVSAGERERAGPPVLRMMAPQVALARHLYETGDRDLLRRQLELISEAGGDTAVLTDARGRDVLTGDDYSALVRRFDGPRLAPPESPVLFERRLYWGTPTADRQYWLLFEVTARRGLWRTVARAHIWILLSVGLLTLWLAHHITDPMRRLGKAVERFGQGDFTARVRLDRKDEIGRLSARFDEMADRIESLVVGQRRLMADLSHELRTPLTRLGLAVELAREKPGDAAALDRIQKEADRLNELVGGLLQVTRGEADPGAVAMAPLSLPELVAEVVEDCRLEGTAIELKAADGAAAGHGPAPLEIHASAELLRRAVENVLRNAIRHSPPGEPVTVEVDSHRVVIRDRGPGVSGEALPRLFDAFYRAGSQSGGFGLGLSIARRAVELHRGTIRAENANPGLRVEIALPANVTSGRGAANV